MFNENIIKNDTDHKNYNTTMRQSYRGSSRKLGSTCPNPPEIRHIFIKFGNFFSDSEKEIVPYVRYFFEKFKKWKKKYRTYGKLYLFSEKIEVRKKAFFKK